MTKKRAVKRRTFEGLPVVDADTNVTLHVTRTDVKKASVKDPAQCAAAKAGQRQLNKDVRVFLTRTYVKERKHWVRFITPESVSREIVAFDRGSAFDPGEYHFQAPSPNQRLGVHRLAGPGKQVRGSKKLPHHATGMIRRRRV